MGQSLTRMAVICLAIGMVVLGGCQQYRALQLIEEEAAEEQTEAPVWAVRTFTGGRQCHDDNYLPPDMTELLARVDVTVLEHRVVHLPVCQACDICPEYAARHYIRIERNALPLAETLDFQLTTVPP